MCVTILEFVSNRNDSNFKSSNENELFSISRTANEIRTQDNTAYDKVKARALFLSSNSPQGSEEKPHFCLPPKDVDDQALNSIKRSSMVTEL